MYYQLLHVVQKIRSQPKMILKFVLHTLIVLTQTGGNSSQLIIRRKREDSPTSPMALSVSNDEYDKDFKESKIKSLTEAIGHAEELLRFALYHGYEELASSISRTNDLLCTLKLNAPRRQMQIGDYFKPA